MSEEKIHKIASKASCPDCPRAQQHPANPAIGQNVILDFGYFSPVNSFIIATDAELPSRPAPA